MWLVLNHVLRLCVGAEPGGTAGAEPCEDTARGSAEAAGAAGGGQEGGGGTTGAGTEEERGAGGKRWVEVEMHTH